MKDKSPTLPRGPLTCFLFFFPLIHSLFLTFLSLFLNCFLFPLMLGLLLIDLLLIILLLSFLTYPFFPPPIIFPLHSLAFFHSRSFPSPPVTTPPHPSLSSPVSLFFCPPSLSLLPYVTPLLTPFYRPPPFIYPSPSPSL